MAKFKCNSCGGIYTDIQAGGSLYFHVCASEVVEPAQFDATGKQTKEEKRTPRVDIRDERPVLGLVYVDGKPHVQIPIPGERTLFTLEPATVLTVSEGKGRTQLD